MPFPKHESPKGEDRLLYSPTEEIVKRGLTSERKSFF